MAILVLEISQSIQRKWMPANVIEALQWGAEAT